MYKAWFLVRHFFLSPLLEVKWLVKKKSSKMAAEPGTEARNLLLLSSPLLILPFFLHTSHCHHGEWLLRTRWSTSSKRTAISWCHNVLYSMGCLTLPLFCCAYFSDQNEKQKVFWSLLRWPLMLSLHPPLFPLESIAKLLLKKAGLRELLQKAPLWHCAGHWQPAGRVWQLRCAYWVKTPVQRISPELNQ